MKNYYKEKVEIAEEQLRLCREGFIHEIKAIGNGLMNSNNIEAVSERVDKISIMKKAVDEIEQTLISAQKSLKAEMDKEESK